MSRLLTEELSRSLPKLRAQERSEDPIVHAIFFFPLSDWKWFVTEGERNGNDVTFFGYVEGFEAELGHFTLSELGGVDIDGFKIERVEDFEPAPLRHCLELHSGRSRTSG